MEYGYDEETETTEHSATVNLGPGREQRLQVGGSSDMGVTWDDYTRR